MIEWGEVDRDLRLALEKAGFDSVDGAFRFSRGQDLSKPDLGTRRRTRLSVTDSLGRRHELYLKRYGPGRWWRRLGKFTSPARREFEAIRRVRRAGVPTMREIVVGHQCPLMDGRGFLVVSAVPGEAVERDGARWFIHEDAAVAEAMTDQLAAMVRTLHESGLVHRDLYACHVFAHDGRGLIRRTEVPVAGTHAGLAALIDAATNPGRSAGNDFFVDYRMISRSEARAIKDAAGVDADGYTHSVDESAVRHILSSRGEGSETPQGSIPIAREDIPRIPEITSAPDTIAPSETRGGLCAIVYSKRIHGSVVYVVEEVRAGRRKLTAKAMWKTEAGDAAGPGLMPTSETLLPPGQARYASGQATSPANHIIGAPGAKVKSPGDESPADLYLIDLARVFRPRWRKFRWRVKDLAQLHYSMPSAWVEKYWPRFLEQYLTPARSAERDLWQRAIARKSESIRRRQLRKTSEDGKGKSE